jgi:phosphosulfolactate synthase (CoM biosynthesis protein A)
MAKKKLIKIAEEQEVEFEEAMRIATEKLPEGSLTGKGKNTWVNEEGTAILEESFMIDEIIPKHYIGKVLQECPNPKYNVVYNKKIGRRVNMLIPRKWQGRLVGKEVTFEAIEDTKGVSYRYVGK